MKTQIALLAPCCALVALVVIAKFTAPESNRSVKSVIEVGIDQQKWSRPIISEILQQGRLKARDAMDAYGWPGDPNNGFCAEALEIATRHASELRGIDFAGVNINGPLREDHINIYFFDSDDFPEAASFKGNCTYTGYKNTIICDRSFLFRFQDIDFIEKTLQAYLRPGEGLEELLKNTRKDYRIAFGMRSLISAHHVLIWALVHEIGHLAHDHKPVSRVESLLDSRAANTKSRTLENQADEFVLGVLKEASSGARALVFSGLQNLAGEQIAIALTAPGAVLPVQLHEIETDIPVKQPTGTHPPMLLRCLNALIVFESELPNLAVEGSVYTRLRNQIIYIK